MWYMYLIYAIYILIAHVWNWNSNKKKNKKIKKFGSNWAKLFWRRRYLNIFNIILHFLYYLPLEKGGPFIWTNLNPLHPRMLCAKFGWNWPSGSGEKVENWRSLQTDRRTDRRRMTGDLKSSLELFSTGELKIVNSMTPSPRGGNFGVKSVKLMDFLKHLLYSGSRFRQSKCIVIMTEEGHTKIVNFICPLRQGFLC